MNKKIILVIFALFFFAVGFFVFQEKEEDQIFSQDEEIKEEVDYKRLREIITGFLGTPYSLGPLGEGDNELLYRTDVFDCTTLVLVTVSKLHGDNPEEEIKNVNYYPPGEVSYETRLHFSTYRNKVNDYFKDITSYVGEGYVNEKKVTLNKNRLIDIDWEKDLVIDYINVKDVSKVVDNLPEVAGVMFMRDRNADIGLDINHEGFILDGEYLVHASPDHGEVYKENFNDYLQRVDNDAVSFYKIN